MDPFKLTKSEMDVMEMFWDSEGPLSVMDISHIVDETLPRKLAVQNVIGSLLRKGAIEMVGVTHNRNKIARTFKPALTPEEYSVMEIQNNPSFKKSSVARIVAALFKDSKEKEALIAELEQIMKEEADNTELDAMCESEKGK